LYLTADIGNTRIKYALWTEEGSIAETGLPQSYQELYDRASVVDAFAWCSTVGPLPEEFQSLNVRNFELDQTARLPFTSLYKTPETLGKDRIAAIAGALKLYPNKNVFVIDAGTCITTDLVTDTAVYHGGSISPGLEMRYKALHQFTEKLPEVKHREWTDILGKSTEESILSGVWNGILGELNFRIEEILKTQPDVVIAVTGGDAPLLADKLKYRIFAEPLIIHHGLLSCLFLNES
jgi:type III pantothenate kinase